MKKKAMILGFLLVLNASAFIGGQDVVEEIVAVVNDDIITRSEYEEQHTALYQMLRSQYSGEAFDEQYTLLKKELLESMITSLLLLQEAKKMMIDVTEQVKINIENIKEEYNIESDEQLRRVIQEQGVDFEVFKKQMEEDMMRQVLIFNEVDRSIVIDDSEIVNYYKLHPEEFREPEEYKLRAIYLSPEGGSEEKLRLKMEEISQKIRAGEEMTALASQYSEGPEKEYQGDLGSFKKGELEKTLEEAVEKLDPGEITPWLEARNGWYLLQLEEKKESRLKSFEEVKEDIENKIFTESRLEKLEEFLKRLREKSYVKILIPNPIEL